MLKTITISLDIDLEEGESVSIERAGDEYRLIAQLGPSRNLIGRVVPVNPSIPMVSSGGKPVTRMQDRENQLRHLLANAPPIQQKRRRAA
jgi:hypothetical protein